MIASSRVSTGRGPLQAKRRPHCRHILRSMLLSAVVALSTWSVGQANANAQSIPSHAPPPSKAFELFIGDAGDNSVKQFDASGTYGGPFVASGSAGLSGPRGMIFTERQLVVVNQNVNTPYNGEVLRYDAETGTYIGKLVSSTDLNAPFAPRGIVRGGRGNAFYVADMLGTTSPCANGSVKVYDDAGAFLGSLSPDPRVFTDVFHPRGLVFGPDGLLYVSSSGCFDGVPPTYPLYDATGGNILRFRFDERTRKFKFLDVFASNKSVPYLHRPEGLVFDKRGNLWVTSFRKDPNNPTDTDKILELDGKSAALVGKIELDRATPTAPRATAQAIIFGPGGNLYIPISGGDPLTTGQVRRCNPRTKECQVIVQANASGGALQSGWYLIFRKSDSATLKYGGQGEDQDRD